LAGGDPGNAILLNGVMQTANREIGVPGFQPDVPSFDLGSVYRSSLVKMGA
jgi:hypothetical protein